MADTIITNVPNTEDDSAGWMVALAILLALILAGAFIYQNGYFRTVAADTSTNVSVTVPAATVSSPTN